VRSEFNLEYPDGGFVRFVGTIGEIPPVNAKGTVDVAVSDIEILENGNRYSPCAADENYAAVSA
jgi:hypothetical protein